MGDFEKWFEDQDFYTNMRFIHGDRLFDKDGDVYRVLPVQIAYQGWNARQSEIEQIKAEIEGLKNPNLAQHTKKYREQCELFKSMSEVEKKAYSAGYDWACKVSQRQILTLIKDQEGVEDKLDDEIDSLKAQLNNMEACYIQIKKINDEQSAIIQGHFAARQDMQKRIDEYKKLTISIRNEFDLWSDDSEFAGVIEAQIENLEALRGEHE